MSYYSLTLPSYKFIEADVWTKLVALAIGDFHYVESNAFHVPTRVYMLPGKEASGHYPATLAAKTMAFFEEQFGTPYPLPKIDIVGYVFRNTMPKEMKYRGCN